MAGEFPVTEHVAKSTRHTTFYLSCGPAGAPLVIFVHGWPELSLSWRHQLPCFASLGFRDVAPDMRGYGRSSVYRDHENYRLEVIVEDMLELWALWVPTRRCGSVTIGAALSFGASPRIIQVTATRWQTSASPTSPKDFR